MQKLILGLLATLVTFSSSCNKDGLNGYETRYSNGNIITSELQIDDFSGILIDSKCDVVYKKGATQKVMLTISENIFNDVATTVVNNIWTIDFKDGDNVATLNEHEFIVVIETPELDYLKMESSGTFICEDPIETSELNLIHDSSGSVSLDCTVETLITKMDGSGNLVINGSADQHNFSHLSSGKTAAFGFTAVTTDLLHDGSGDAEIFTSTTLSGLMDGSGDVFYKGSPTINVTVEGSGELVNAN